VSRLRAQDAGLAESELVMTRRELDALRDKLYVLECAVEDAERDTEAGVDPAESLAWVVESARPLFSASLGDPT
jgi:hypothetical protein